MNKPVALPSDGEWLPLAEHARSRGISERKLRRQLIALHQRQGGGVLRSYNEAGTKVRKWFFNPAAVKAGLERDPDEAEISLGEHLLRIEDSEKKLEALRQSLNAVKAKVKGIEKRISS